MQRIRKLHIEVVNKIAAGEVVQKPSSALKELIENSLDAQSTSIIIKLRDGGMSLLQISDNGTGIHFDDFPILCHRFTTSKISAYEDLSNLFTFGFRGEALSSISQVSRLTVCSRKQGEPLGYKAEYIEGELIAPPQPYAYDKGTVIIAEDMFGNNPGRKRALSDHADLHKRSWEITAKYALQYPQVTFKFIKGDTVEFSTSGKNDKIEAVKVLLRTCKPESEIIEIPATTSKSCTYSALLSNSQYTPKQKLFILFVNGRLVESSELRRLLTEIYNTHFPKSSAYFIYLSIIVNPSEIDVNVHPTKQEVRFSKQAQVFSEITSRVQEVLNSSNESRTLTIKTFEIPKGPAVKPLVSSLVRATASVPLEWFIQPKALITQKVADEQLKSVEKLKNEICVGKEQEILDRFTYIGCVNQDIALVQYGTSMYMLMCANVFQCLIYQYILENFAQMPSMEVVNSNLSITKLLEIALENPNLAYNPTTDPPIPDLLSNYSRLLQHKSGLLEEYFSFTITDGVITQLPMLIDGLIKPDINNLAEFILRLCTDVVWKNEKKCLEKISQLFAWFYSKTPEKWEVNNNEFPYEYHYKNSLFPYLRGRVKADIRSLSEGAGIIHVVSTESLYKIFERC